MKTMEIEKLIVGQLQTNCYLVWEKKTNEGVIIDPGDDAEYILNRIKDCPEVCRIFCATANPLDVIVAETEQGRAILGVVDGVKPTAIETGEDVAQRKSFLRMIGYKL